MLAFIVSFLLAVAEANSTTQTAKQVGWIKQVVTPSVLTMLLTFLVFALILAFGLRNMMAIKTPVQFAERSLVLNKEY